MNRHAIQLISRGAINKIGNMLYDYGNSVWLASIGTIGQTVLGIYQISELVTSILVNPFGGVISDRFFASQNFDDDGLDLWYSLFSYFFHKK
ncbi:Transporter, major facilitator family protein [Streptococcus oralis subsp. tigurinus]|uniref:Transporter, major facilitator family protein n=1 Tax=Streptococcus oralis subsp. tigurinus TaxID=1077464 RepID=A0A224A7J3_STROR|nr:Transporter, major facilitator family protein [Streptococcus oralis subsp. tigurinus]